MTAPPSLDSQRLNGNDGIMKANTMKDYKSLVIIVIAIKGKPCDNNSAAFANKEQSHNHESNISNTKNSVISNIMNKKVHHKIK